MERIKNILKNLLFPPDSPEDDGYEYYEIEGKRSKDDEWNDFWKYDKFPFAIRIIYLITLLHIILLDIRFLISLATMNSAWLPGSISYVFLWSLIPAGIWIWSTAYEYWNFHNRKITSLYLVVTNVITVIAALIGNKVFRPVVRAALLIPINKEITESMVVNLARAVIVILSWLPALTLFVMLYRMISEPENRANIVNFKILL